MPSEFPDVRGQLGSVLTLDDRVPESTLDEAVNWAIDVSNALQTLTRRRNEHWLVDAPQLAQLRARWFSRCLYDHEKTFTEANADHLRPRNLGFVDGVSAFDIAWGLLSELLGNFGTSDLSDRSWELHRADFTSRVGMVGGAAFLQEFAGDLRIEALRTKMRFLQTSSVGIIPSVMLDELKCLDTLQAKPLNLLIFMNDRVIADEADLAPEVWKDHPTDNAVKTAVRKANEALAGVGFDRCLSRERGKISWS